MSRNRPRSLKTKLVVGLACVFSLVPLASKSASSSLNYAITRSVLNSGGGSSNSSSYGILSAIGQPSAVGATSSTNYNVVAGFISIPDSDGDGFLDNTDPDDDNDGLSDVDEYSFGSNPLLSDSDEDGLNDLDEFNAGTNPNNTDTDGDGLLDGIDPDPLVPTAVLPDGDLAPYLNPDGFINAADLLIAQRIVNGLVAQPTGDDLTHGDVYPPGAPDGVIDIRDLILIQKLVLQ